MTWLHTLFALLPFFIMAGFFVAARVSRMASDHVPETEAAECPNVEAVRRVIEREVRR